MKFRIGVIGAGHWGPNHLRAFSGHPDSEAPLCAETDAAKRDRLADLYPEVRFCEDCREILDAPEVDAVVVSTPTATHYEIVKAAMAAGKDVLCEKPVTLEYAEAIELAELSEKLGRILMVGHIFLFNNGILALKDILSEGRLGRSYYLHSARTNLGPVRSDVNVVHDLASHDVSIFGFLLGMQPTHVTAAGMNYLQGSIEDVAFITLYYPGDIIANCHVSWLHPKKVRELTIVGDRKMATWNDLSPSGPVAIYSKEIISDQTYADFGEFNLLVKEGDINIPHIPMTEPLKAQTDAFLESLKTRKPHLSDGRFAADVVQVLEAINNSIRNNGRVVAIQP